MKQSATPYIMFNGNAKEALELYKEVFEGEVVFKIRTYGEAIIQPHQKRMIY